MGFLRNFCLLFIIIWQAFYFSLVIMMVRFKKGVLQYEKNKIIYLLCNEFLWKLLQNKPLISTNSRVLDYPVCCHRKL